jgi:hypothetical protein
VAIVLLAGLAVMWLWQKVSGSPMVRAALLPASDHPVRYIAGTAVGWYWVAFIAAPAAAVMGAILWAAAVAAGNRRVPRIAEPGVEWPGYRSYGPALATAAAAAIVAAIGVMIRVCRAAAGTGPGLVLLSAAAAAGGWLAWHAAVWARQRALLQTQLNRIVYLCAPVLGWPELQPKQARITGRRYRRGEPPRAQRLELLYGWHPGDVGAEMIPAVTGILAEVTGQDYAIDNDELRRILVATPTTVEVEDTPEVMRALRAKVIAWFGDDATVPMSGLRLREPDPAAETATAQPGENAAATSRATAAGARGRKPNKFLTVAAFTVNFTYSKKVDTPFRRKFIEGQVADVLAGTIEAEWDLYANQVEIVRAPGLPMFCYPPTDSPHVTRAKIRALYKDVVIPYAVDAYGNVIGWCPDLSTHLLIAGSTGAGKTILMITVAIQCALRGWNVVVIDPKARDFPGVRGRPNVTLVTSGLDDDGMAAHAAALRFVADTMRDRYSRVKNNPALEDEFDPILVVVDEFANLAVELAKFFARWRHRNERFKLTENDIEEILRTARAVRIHLVIGLQRPDIRFIAGEARDNTTHRIAVGRLQSKDAAIMMFNDPVAGTRLQPGIKGRATVQLPDGSLREVQVFYTPKPPASPEQERKLCAEDRRILAELAAVNVFWPRRVVESRLRDFDPQNPPTFAEIRDSPILLATDRPDLDPLSDQFVVPQPAVRRPTMDDDHPPAADDPPTDQAATSSPQPLPQWVYEDQYELSTIDDEYGEPFSAPAEDIQSGDLVDVSIDGSGQWRYVHHQPELLIDEEENSVLAVHFRALDDSTDTDGMEVDPGAVYQLRRLHIGD